jgi:hypothetical protein
MADDEAQPRPVERKDVIAYVAEVPVPGEILARKADELKLLGAVDRLVSLAGSQALTRFHFHESKYAPASHNEIDFTAAESFIARDDRISTQTIKPRRPAFSTPAEIPRIHRT